MATILAHITVHDGQETRFEAVIRDLYAATHGQERGVRRYEYWRGSQARRYYALLAFDDFGAFISHQTSEHHEAAAADLRETIEEIRLEWVDPVAGASDLPATEHQATPSGSDELTRRYGQIYAAQIADWWAGLRPAT